MRNFKLLRLDSGLDKLIVPDAKLETLGEHFGLNKGPCECETAESGLTNEIWITSKDGKHLGSIQLPQITSVEPRPRIVPTNLRFATRTA